MPYKSADYRRRWLLVAAQKHRHVVGVDRPPRRIALGHAEKRYSHCCCFAVSWGSRSSVTAFAW